MSIQLYSIEHAPRTVPVWHVLMDDLCKPPAHRVAHVLGLSVRTIRRYNTTGTAPRCVCLAVFWLTSWGRQAVHTQAANDAALAVGYVNALRTEVDALKQSIEHLHRIGNFGSANEPTDANRPHRARRSIRPLGAG